MESWGQQPSREGMEIKAKRTVPGSPEKESRDEGCIISLLGVDQLLAILQLLPVPSILSFGMACHRFHSISNMDSLWAAICRRDWGSRVVDAWCTSARSKVGWKQLYCHMLFPSAASWQRMDQGDMIPAPRASHSMNNVAGKITVFGGGCDGGRHLDDTWVASLSENILDGVAWQQVSIGTPSGRFGQSTIVVGDVLVLFGGINDRGIRQSDTWINKGMHVANTEERSSWQLLEVAQAPPPRGAHAGCYAGDRKVVIFGGIGSDGIRLRDTWMLDLSEAPVSWHEVVTLESPSARSGHTLTWIGGKHMVLFGGRGHSASLIFGGRILIFGGEDARRSRKGDIWVLDPNAGLEVERGTSYTSTSYRCTSFNEYKFTRRFWKRLKQRGRPPGKRSFHGACTMDSSHAVFIFGGMIDGELSLAAALGLGFDDGLYMLQLVP
ncbi:hypothetical protein O6H91_17G088600 [Diphasiastrum complanatum]|uniref:Uncharacterized protein n=1 Tax=Diphasiastrum complanatum TaxID=34168 RepID=A0ACC2B9T0_DIPCM|nr:hypothetical protein O6H91_17G088600 [Diphasiastrum complanatum]